MPRKRGLRVRGKVTGIEKVGSNLRRASASLDSIQREGLDDWSSTGVQILQEHAPVGRTRRLHRGIKARKRGNNRVDITMHAVNPLTGFDYVNVTRFGHRVAYITPTEGRKSLKLRLTDGGTVYRRKVRGVEVTHDWAQDGMDEIRAYGQLVARGVKRELELRLFS